MPGDGPEVATPTDPPPAAARTAKARRAAIRGRGPVPGRDTVVNQIAASGRHRQSRKRVHRVGGCPGLPQKTGSLTPAYRAQSRCSGGELSSSGTSQAAEDAVHLAGVGGRPQCPSDLSDEAWDLIRPTVAAWRGLRPNPSRASVRPAAAATIHIPSRQGRSIEYATAPGGKMAYGSRDYVADWLVELLHEKFITPHKASLLREVTKQEKHFHASRKGCHPAPDSMRVTRAMFDGYQAIVKHERNGETGRVDVFYINTRGVRAVIGSWKTGPWRFKINFVYAHAVVKHGSVIEWWLVHEHGRFRVTPLKSDEMAKALLYRVYRNIDVDPYHAWSTGLKIAGLTAGAALLLASGGSAGAAGAATSSAIARVGPALGVTSLGQALGNSSLQNREELKKAITAHQALLLKCVVEKLRNFDTLVSEARQAGRGIPHDHLEGHELIPGYSVTTRFSQTPGHFTTHYSGDDGLPFGNNQGTIEFRNHQLTSWWFLTAKKRIKLV